MSDFTGKFPLIEKTQTRISVLRAHIRQLDSKHEQALIENEIQVVGVYKEHMLQLQEYIKTAEDSLDLLINAEEEVCSELLEKLDMIWYSAIKLITSPTSNKLATNG